MTTELKEIAEMRGELTGLTTRVGTLEQRVDSGFDRMEKLFKSEINDLKTEQLSDVKRESNRLADDQRRLWDEFHAQSRLYAESMAKQQGSKETKEAFFSVGNIIATIFGGLLVTVASWLLGMPMHH